MLWLFISIIAYFLNAITAVIDKILISKEIPDPKIYTFFISVLGIVGIVLAPFGLSMISIWYLFIAVLIGLLSILALLALFNALKIHEASRVVPIVGAIQPIVIFFLAFSFLHERLSLFEIIAVAFFIIGGILITIEFGKKKKNGFKWLIYAILSGVLFGILYSMNKYLFNELGFINGFVWPRITTCLVALLFLLDKRFLNELKLNLKTSKSSSKGLFLIGQACGASFFVLINYAISLGSVTIVNSMQGLQYAFVLIMTTILAYFSPKLIKENFNIKILIQKVFAIILIAFGIIFLNI